MTRYLLIASVIIYTLLGTQLGYSSSVLPRLLVFEGAYFLVGMILALLWKRVFHFTVASDILGMFLMPVSGWLLIIGASCLTAASSIGLIWLGILAYAAGLMGMYICLTGVYTGYARYRQKTSQ